MPSLQKIPNPPFWGRRVMRAKELDFDMVCEWINKRTLFKLHWGYKRAGMAVDEYQKLMATTVYPAYERIKKEIVARGLFDPTILYGYYRCRSEDQTLKLFDEDGNAMGGFSFPRQRKQPHRALSDFFSPTHDDILPLTCVSVGGKFSEYEKELYAQNHYLEYNLVHGFGVELAEALAEVAHKQIRLDLGIQSEDEGNTLRDVRMNRYAGARYSFGYPACPDLEQSQLIFELLRPEEFGIILSETYQIHPEQSTTALVVHHREACYYSV